MPNSLAWRTSAKVAEAKVKKKEIVKKSVVWESNQRWEGGPQKGFSAKP